MINLQNENLNNENSLSIRQAQDPEYIEGKIENWSLKIKEFFLTISKGKAEILKSREIPTPLTREISTIVPLLNCYIVKKNKDEAIVKLFHCSIARI